MCNVDSRNTKYIRGDVVVENTKIHAPHSSTAGVNKMIKPDKTG
jgi:hypothetical protein